MTDTSQIDDATAYPVNPLWARVAVVLIVTLSLTHVVLTTAGGIPVTAFIVACSLLVPIFFLGAERPRRFYNMGPIAAWLVLNTLINIQYAKLNSVIYSFMFLAAFVAIMNCGEHLTRGTFVRTLKIIIVAYFVNVLVSQLLVVAGAPHEVLGWLFHRGLDEREGIGIRYYGFSSEPSYAAFIVLVCFLALYRTPGALEGKQVLIFGAVVSYQTLAFNSIYGYVMALAIGSVIAYERMRRANFIALLSAIVLTGVVAEYQGEGRFVRLATAFVVEGIDGIESLGLLDASLFMRVAPVVDYVESADPLSSVFYIGHGAMTNTLTYTELFAHWLDVDILFQPSFLPGFTYDYGVVGAILVIITISRLISERVLSLCNVVLFAILFNASLNTQLFWFVVVVLALTKQYRLHTETGRTGLQLGNVGNA